MSRPPNGQEGTGSVGVSGPRWQVGRGGRLRRLTTSSPTAMTAKGLLGPPWSSVALRAHLPHPPLSALSPCACFQATGPSDPWPDRGAARLASELSWEAVDTRPGDRASAQVCVSCPPERPSPGSDFPKITELRCGGGDLGGLAQSPGSEPPLDARGAALTVFCGALKR